MAEHRRLSVLKVSTHDFGACGDEACIRCTKAYPVYDIDGQDIVVIIDWHTSTGSEPQNRTSSNMDFTFSSYREHKHVLDDLIQA